ncbi:flagellar protein FhlB [Permianibacter sp. IMCC34836]|uniref:EscU/YscU/HrcU family type III secretion system export apparatus switch protein n=1 Tax=Permianibacter fluminis TaxID=2738515 RepID=UPI001551E5E6|nr:EscU/YscU/HrcU family type III secretion system export apparatus switch protein [Permianibacter fluminis]NQD38223.1 flagellar protein FhlB [Permianibacter fluminis]
MSGPETAANEPGASDAGSARTAAALKYDGDSAPRLIAKGRGDLAEQIIALAQQHGVYLHEDPVLAQALQQLRLNQEIPRKLYVAIARVIAFAYFLQGKTPQR